MVVHTCERCGKEFPKLAKLRIHLERKNPCKPKVDQLASSSVTSNPQEGILISLDDTPSCQPPANLTSILTNPAITLNDDLWFNAMEERYNVETDQIWPELGGNLLSDKAPRKKLIGGGNMIRENYELSDEPLLFEECEKFIDPLRPHQNLSSMSLWQAVIPSINNPNYSFNRYIDNPKKYAEAPYMPQLIKIARDQITKVLKAELRRKDQIKSAIVAYCIFHTIKREKGKGPRQEFIYPHLRGEMRPILLENDIDEHIDLSANEIDKKIEDFMTSGSGWNLVRIEMLTIEVYTLRRAVGGSYIPTPPKLALKKCTINPDNSNIIDPVSGKPSDNCLQGALGAYFAHKDGNNKDLCRIFTAKAYKKYLDIVNLDGIPMPTPICPRVFEKIEKQNPTLSINIWKWKEEECRPKPIIASKNFYISNSCKIVGCKHPRPNECHENREVIHLMALSEIDQVAYSRFNLIQNIDKEGKYGTRTHFLWIKDPSKLVFKDTTHTTKRHLCDRCFLSFNTKSGRDYHREHCYGLGEAPQVITMPKADGEENFEKFKNFKRMMYTPCVIITDFESFNINKDESYGGNMRKVAEQPANSFSYSVHWIDTGDVWGPFTYRGPNATNEFIKRMDNEYKRINDILAIKVERIITDEDRRKFYDATNCWICDRSLNHDRVWDHCHITGKYRGACHSECNLKLRIEPGKTSIPIVFHNFRGYDSHLVAQSLSKSARAHQIRVIAETFEKYKSIQVGQFRYIDSMQFMNSSLSNLAENLGAVTCKNIDCKHLFRIDNNRCIESLENYKITKQHYQNQFTEKQIAMLCVKGVYPYDYIDSFDRFLETELPAIEKFYSNLSRSKISQKDYERAQKVWKEFSCKNIGEYHDLYLKTDVLLLADIWTKFRETSMKYYKLDPSYYVSAPALSWDAMLKYTGVEIELFTEISMHDFVEKAKRGGIAIAGHRYFEANNPKLGKDFNPSKPTTWISYVDANNLYGWAMSQYLPIRNYKWEGRRGHFRGNKELQKRWLNIILKLKEDSKRGCFVNIRSHFPLKTHDYLKDLPPAVDSIDVKKDWLSPYNKDQLDGNRYITSEKLVPHLGPRDNYVIHYLELQYYVKLGMIVDEIYEILSFDQSNWLAPYIKLNTEFRQKAKNNFEKDFFKLMNNSIYGKTMENVRNYLDVKLMPARNEDDEKKMLKKINKSSFKYAKQLSENLVGVNMGKQSVTLNKPIIVGASVLGLSKLLMYRFWYGYIKKKYGNKAKLGYMDTDSFIILIETEDIYKDMIERPDIFDLNDSKTIGLFKDECPDNIIKKSFHIRAKLYHYVLADESSKSKHKGVSKSGMKEMAINEFNQKTDDPLPFNPENEIDDPLTYVYWKCLFGDKVYYAKNIGIRSKNHILSVVESEKKAMCPINDKKWVFTDKISDLPYFHWRINAIKSFISKGMTPEKAEKNAMGLNLKSKFAALVEEHINL